MLDAAIDRKFSFEEEFVDLPQRVQSDFQVGQAHAVAEISPPVLQLPKFAVPSKL